MGFAAKTSHVELKLFTENEIDIYHFVERGIRGGISTVCASRYCKADNKYCSDTQTENPNYIVCYDMKSLYPTVMTRKLPVSGFKWVTVSSNKDF